MAYDYIDLHPGRGPLYEQLYEALKQAVESGRLPKGSRIPSIRKLSEDLGISRTTIESDYQQLAIEGYIKSEPQRGYFVIFGSRPLSRPAPAPTGASLPYPLRPGDGQDRRFPCRSEALETAYPRGSHPSGSSHLLRGSAGRTGFAGSSFRLCLPSSGGISWAGYYRCRRRDTDSPFHSLWPHWGKKSSSGGTGLPAGGTGLFRLPDGNFVSAQRRCRAFHFPP